MRTRLQRRNMISSWYFVFLLLIGCIVGFVSLWAFTTSRGIINELDNGSISPDVAIPVLVDDDSLKVSVNMAISDSAKRPMWAMSRRPYVAPKPTKKPKPKPKPEKPKEIPSLEVQLSSVIIAQGVEMIFLNTSKGIIRLELGMSYNGWKLTNINEDSAEFHFDEETKIVQLRAFANASPRSIRALGGDGAQNTDKK